MNVLFLDMDGVINGTEFEKQYFREYGIRLRCFGCVCPVMVHRVNKLIEEFDLKIVWSSDWRFAKEQYNSWKNPKDWIEKNFLEEGIVIGNNPRKMSSNRFEEIHFWFTSNEYSKKFYGKEWVKGQYYEVRNYVVIDDFDSPGMKMYGNHFFKCNPDIGLTIEYAS